MCYISVQLIQNNFTFTRKYAMRLYVKFFILGWAPILISCATSNKINLLKPVPDEAPSITLDQPYSFLSLPVTIGSKDLETQINKILKDVLYEDTNIEDDNLKLKAIKTKPIKIHLTDEKLVLELPIKATGTYRYGFSSFGVSLYDTKDFDLHGIATFTSDIGLTNWQLHTKTQLTALEWTEAPTITIAGKKVAITYVINPAIRLFKTKIEKNIDTALKEFLDFKPQVLEALETLAEPMLMNEVYETWFRIAPVELYATDALIENQEIGMQLGLKCRLETFIGQQPEKTFEAKSIILKPVKSIPNQFQAKVTVFSSYQDASKIITKNFSGETFGQGKQQITIREVNLWQRNHRIIIALALKGSINGTIYLAGVPKYDSLKQEIYFDEMDYALDTKNFIIKSAQWMAQGYILKKIQEQCRYSIKENMEEGKANIASYLQNYSPMQGIYVNGDLTTFEFETLALTNEAIVAIIKAKGVMRVQIDGLE